MKIKKIIACATAIACIMPSVVFASETTGETEIPAKTAGEYVVDTVEKAEEDLTYSLLSDGTYAVTGLSEKGKNASSIVIPDNYNGAEVSTIKDKAFNSNENLTSVSIGNNVTNIGNEAFAGDTNLAEVTIGNNVIDFGSNVFVGTEYADTELVDGMLIVNGVLLDGSATRGEIVIPDYVTEIAPNAFAVTSIKETEKGYEISVSTNIGLKGVTIPSSVTKIGKSAFAFCTRLEYVVNNANITTIPTNCFGSCYSLTEMNIPKTVTTIEATAFATNKTSKLVIPASVKTIAKNAFSSFGGSLIYVEGKASMSDFTSEVDFNNVKVIYELGQGEKLAEESDMEKYFTITSSGQLGVKAATKNELKEMKSIVIPDTINGIKVTSIGKRAFYGFKNVEEVTLPQHLTTLRDSCFEGCYNLKTINWNEKIKTLGFSCFRETGFVDVVIPDTVKKIDRWAFMGCPQLNSVIIPESVTLIRDNAFNSCKKLKEVTFLHTDATISFEERIFACNYTMNVYVQSESVKALLTDYVMGPSNRVFTVIVK